MSEDGETGGMPSGKGGRRLAAVAESLSSSLRRGRLAPRMLGFKELKRSSTKRSNIDLHCSGKEAIEEPEEIVTELIRCQPSQR